MTPPARAQANKLNKRPIAWIRAILLDSFYRNSLLLILNYALIGVLALTFWAVAARTFPAAEIGDVAALFAGLTFVSIAAGLGLPNTTVRYIASVSDRHSMLLGSMLLVGLGALLITALIIAVPGHLGLPIAGQVGWTGNLLVLVLAVLASVGTIADAVMVGLRATGTIVVKNVIAGLTRISFLPFVSGDGEIGLLGCLALGATVATVITLVANLRWLGPRVSARLHPLSALAGKARFSVGNHVAMLVASGPLFVLPVYVVHVLGPAQAAYLAACLNLMTALNAIPTTVSQSLFAELAARPSERLKLTIRAFRTVYFLTIPIVALMCVLASVALGLFGGEYATATTCLRLMATGAIFGSFNYLADVVLNATEHIKAFTAVNVVGAIITLGLTMTLGAVDLTFLGLGWLLGQVIYTLIAAGAITQTGVLRAPAA